MAENKRVDLTINITADVDEVVAGLKRLQRETTDVIYLDEFAVSTKDAEITYYDLSDVPTKELHEELSKREGVEEHYVRHHGDIANLYLADEDSGGYIIIEGPARILVNKD